MMTVVALFRNEGDDALTTESKTERGFPSWRRRRICYYKKMRRIMMMIMSVAAGMPATADLAFESTRKQLVAPMEGGVLTLDFPFTNPGDRTVTISRHESGCGCMTSELADGKKAYAKGEKGIVKVKINTAGLLGVVRKELLIWEDGISAKPSARLAVEITIPEPVKVEPKVLRWNTGEKADAKVMKITTDLAEKIHIDSIDIQDETFNHSIKTLEDGRSYEIWITPKDTNKSRMTSIRIKTDCPISRGALLTAFAAVKSHEPSQQADLEK